MGPATPQGTPARPRHKENTPPVQFAGCLVLPATKQPLAVKQGPTNPSLTRDSAATTRPHKGSLQHEI